MQIQDFAAKFGSDTIPWRLFVPKDAGRDYCVLWLQGWTSSMDSHREGVARIAQQTTLPFATLDYAGHGLHQTPLEDSTRKQQLEEVIAVFDELTARGYQKIIAIGGSFGAYMAALLTAQRPVQAVILRAPANYVDNEFQLPHRETASYKDPAAWIGAKVSDPELLNGSAVEAITSFEGFVYVLEHELDHDVPARLPQTYFAAAKKGNYFIIPHTGHSPKLMPNPEKHFAYIEHVVGAILKAIQLQDNLSRNQIGS